MEPLVRLDSKSILAEDIFLEIFDQEDEIMKARMILSLTDRAAELGVKKKFEELLKAYKKVDREAKQRERKKPIAMLDKWTNFEGPYNNMFCGAWVAGEDGIFAQNDSQVETVACYHPILPIERMKNLETGEEQIKTDKHPRPYALSIGMCFTLVGLLLLAFAENYFLILLAVSVIGLGSSASNRCWITSISSR